MPNNANPFMGYYNVLGIPQAENPIPLAEFNDGQAVAGQDQVYVGLAAQQMFNDQQAMAQNVAIQEIQEKMMKFKVGKYNKLPEAKSGRSASQLSDEYRDLGEQVAALKGSIHQESEELANVLEGISKQVEVVRDIGSTIQHRISSLLQAANQLETWRLSLHPPGSSESAPALPEGRLPPSEVHQPVEAGLKPIAPGLWQLGQV